MDRVTKVALLLIAAGLWANVAMTVIQPARAAVATDDIVIWLGRIGVEVQAIHYDIDAIVKGGPDCKNKTLCQ